MQWGLFTIPKYKIGSRFDVEIFLDGGKNVDAFHNNYEPPGSLPPSVIARYSGRLFEARGGRDPRRGHAGLLGQVPPGLSLA